MAVSSPRKASRNFRVAPEAFYGDLDQMLKSKNLKPAFRQIIEWVRQIAEVGNLTQSGKTNNLGTFTLATSVASTTLTDKLIGSNSIIQYWPTTANASAEKGAGTIYQTHPNTTREQAVINHANNATADRTFVYTVVG